MTAATASDYKIGDVALNEWGLPIEIVGIGDGYFIGAGGVEWTVNGDGRLTPYDPPAPAVNGANSAAANPRFKPGDSVNVVIHGQVHNADGPATVTAVYDNGGAYGYTVRGVFPDNDGNLFERDYTTTEDSLTLDMLTAALWYARSNWHVIPLHEPLFDAGGRCSGCTCEAWQRQNGKPAYVCPTPGKHPRIRDWDNKASTDPAQVRQWWQRWPTANIGIAAGPSNLVVVDKDTYQEVAGDGILTIADSETVTSLTGGGGEHLIYRHPESGPPLRNDDKALPTWVNIRAHGGQFVAPPSLHKSGHRYEWETGYGPHEIAIAPLPEPLRVLLQAGDGKGDNGQRPRAASIPERIAGGGRNNTLTSLAGSMRRRGLGAAVIEAALLKVNAEQCDPPLSEDEVKAIAASVAQYAPSPNGKVANSAGATATQSAPPAGPFKLDDTGNSERFVAQHGDGVRYDHSTGHWLIWTGTHWRRDDDGAAQRMAKATARTIYDEAATAARAGNDDLAAQLAKWARTSAAESRRNAMLNLARSEYPVALTHDRLNRHDLLLNVQNGTLDLATGKLKPHERGDRLTYVLSVAYDPAAECPLWGSFIHRITNGDGDLTRFLAAAVGYTLSGLTTAQVLFFLYGRGANGKSTFIETIMALMGDLGHKARAQILMADERERVPNEIAALAGRRLVVASELADGGRMNEGLVKDLTGGDTMSARFLYGEPFTFKPTFKLWLYGNHKPVIVGTDDGIWRRVRLIPFTVQIPENERDPDLPAKLRGELPGILAWAVRGWKAYQAHGLGTPAAVTKATAEYRIESDIIGQFLDERCILQNGETTEAGKLYAAYINWATENGLRSMSNVRFAKALTERGLTKEKNTTTGRMEYQHIGLPA